MKLLTLEAAAHRMAGLPARTVRCKGCGIVAEDAFADLVPLNSE